AAAGDVERHGNEIALLDELNIATALDHFARDLMPQHHTSRRRSAAAHHVLIAAADIGGDQLDNGTVLALALTQYESREIDTLDFHLARTHVHDAAIAGHDDAPVAYFTNASATD